MSLIHENPESSNVASLTYLTDEELRHHYLVRGNSYPIADLQGNELFDANESRTLSQREREDMVDRLENKFTDIFEILRISRNDPNSTDTPYRLARMLVFELLSGRFEPPPKITMFPNRRNVDELVISRGIRVMSMCSHHWQTIHGECTIGYVPNDLVIGISKLTRIVEWFSRRGQIQEELGEQIADYIEHLLAPKALGIVVKSQHFCMIARGVAAHHQSEMITQVMRGSLATNQLLRDEFIAHATA